MATATEIATGAATGKYYEPSSVAISGAPTDYGGQYKGYDGFDLILRQNYLRSQMARVEVDIRSIEQNANLSDTEKMFSMQMAMNTWSAISNLRTNMLKTVADSLKSVARNIS